MKNTKIEITESEEPTVLSVLISAAATLGSAKEKLNQLGWDALASRCQAAIDDLALIEIV